MHPLKQTKSKNVQRFSSPIFHYKQLCFWFHEDSSTLKVFKMYFVFFSGPIQNIARAPAHFCTIYQKFGDVFCDIDLFWILTHVDSYANSPEKIQSITILLLLLLMLTLKFIFKLNHFDWLHPEGYFCWLTYRLHLTSNCETNR